MYIIGSNELNHTVQLVDSQHNANITEAKWTEIKPAEDND